MDYDVAIVGAGWAGFNAALRARDLGLKVALIEKGQLGGTCLNRGCIPTKALIHSAKSYCLVKKAGLFGIDTSDARISFSKIQERKNKIVQQLRQGMQSMLKGIDLLNQEARILSARQLNISGQTIDTKSIIIAVGSRPLELADLKFDGKKIISSDDILNLKEIPRSLLIIGGGVIGCEFASLFSNLGAKVNVVELMPQLLPGMDKEVAKKLENIFKKKQIKVDTNTDANKVNLSDYDLALLCIGRTPATGDLDLDKLGIKLEKGKILVDEYLKTGAANIYAAGDCTGKTMLAHFAAYQGRIAAENIASAANPRKADNKNIPSCIFTDPEIASVGMTEEEAEGAGLDIRAHKFDFMGSAMARILDETEGFVKIITEQKTEAILGASIIGPRATELIGILSVAISSRLATHQVMDTIFAHPTLSEAIADTLKNII